MYNNEFCSGFFRDGRECDCLHQFGESVRDNRKVLTPTGCFQNLPTMSMASNFREALAENNFTIFQYLYNSTLLLALDKQFLDTA